MIFSRTQHVSERILLFVCAIAVASLCPSILLAQETTEAGEVTDTATSSEAVTELDASPSITDPRELGYKVERIPDSATVIGDFVVGPGKIELEIEPGESQVVEISATNRTGVDRIFKFTTEDTAGTPSGDSAIVLLGDDEGPYSLRDYLDIPKGGVMIRHGQRVRIPVRVSIPPDAEPGGLYGSVIVETVTLSRQQVVESGAVAQSPVVSRIGSLFFVTVAGDIERGGELRSFTTVPDKSLFGSGPITFALVYENTGSIHTTPYGELEVFNQAGESVGFVELEPWFAMPQSLRFREVTWDREFLLGKYTAVARINRGYDDIIDEYELSFWVVPWKFAAAVFGVLFITFFIFRFFFRNFEFKRKS